MKLTGLILTVMALIPFTFHGKNAKVVVDFNYPQTVSENAISDLNKALRNGNGQMVVDALVRYSIAQSGISEEKMPEIISRIDSTIAIEKKPHIKALLYYFEAMVMNNYSDNFARSGRTSPEDAPLPDDYSEWSIAQFNNKIAQLLQQALSQPDELKRIPITKMQGTIVYDDIAPTYIPTLYEFLSLKCADMAENSQNIDLSDKIHKQWIENETENVPAYIFAYLEHSTYGADDLYRKFSDNEHSGLALTKTYGSYSYDLYKEYVARFPNSYYTPAIKNKIIDIESKSVSVKYPENATSKENVTVEVSSRNVNDIDIKVYRFPDKLINRLDEKFGEKVDMSKLNLVKTVHVHTDGTVPFNSSNLSASIGTLPYGIYMILPEYKVGNKTISDNSIEYYNKLTVTDIMMLAVREPLSLNDELKSSILVVNSTTGAPVPGVSISYRGGDLGKTDANGCLNISQGKRVYENRCDLIATLGDDRYSNSMPYSTFRNGSDYKNSNVEVFTDLAIYRPGETVKWAIVAYETGINVRNVIPQTSYKVVFKDPNGKEVASTEVTTDDYGRAEGTFDVPTDRMNGNFVINVTAAKGNRGYTYHRVAVSEYKTPTFDITFPDAKSSFTLGEKVTLQGKAETYSGMPIANTEVKLQLYQDEWRWWWWARNNDSGEMMIDTIATTDANGIFTIEVPADKFYENKNNKRWAYYNYKLHATCTDAAGETHEADHYFIIGQRRGIELTKFDITHVNTEPLKLPLKFNSTDSESATTTCDWTLTDLTTKQVVKTGTLSTDNPVIDFTSLPSRQYDLRISITGSDEDDDDAHAITRITLYRETDNIAPIDNTTMWIPEASRRVDENNVAHIIIGTSAPESHIYYVAQSRKKIIKEGWLHYKPGLHQFTVTIPNDREEYVNIEFVNVHDKVVKTENFTLSAPANAQKLKVKATTFRNKLVPGEREHWTLQLVDKDGKPRPGALIFEMYDKAINSIAANTWNLSAPYRSQSLFSVGTMNYTGTNSHTKSWSQEQLDENSYSEPYLFIYDQYIFSRLRVYESNMAMGGASVRMLKSAVAADNMVMRESAMMDEMGSAEEEKSQETAPNPALDNIKLRETDVKTALWLPMLTSDEQGNVQIEFDAPEFNTTWIVQAIGLDKMLYTDIFGQEVLTQKPIMVKANAPRFLRHGDVATLAANVQNATDAATTAQAVIELFDPRTGEIFTSKNFNAPLDPRGTQAVKIGWTVPDDIAFVGLRVKAANDSHGDGEQVMIPVLEAASPVIETKPFYIEAGAQRFVADIPQVASKARVTLEYCDNPMWYCITALPTIFDENYNISTRLAHNLFAIDIAQGIANAQPQIREAVNYWKTHDEDSTLVSMLAKNQDLKVGTLLASPWVREADRQTLRMSRINELLDVELMKAERNKIIEALEKLQLGDGGWTWYRYPDCKSSVWVTEEVLQLIGEIRHVGFLPDDARLTAMTKKALSYLDREMLRMYNEQKDKKSLDWFTTYAYTRTLYNDVPMSSNSKSLFDKVLKHMNKNWGKGLSLGEKAFYAMTLKRNGYAATATDIMESVRQFALVKPELGMYWDNLQVGWRYFDKVAVTSTILQALNECDPRQQELDNVRKWMLLMKQSNDWGSSSLAADAVYSLVSTGTQWLERNPMPKVSVGGEVLEFEKLDEYLGYCRKTIEARAGASLIIERSGSSPAWGAVYTQFTAPMKQIPEVAITEISINKEFYRYNTDGTLVPVTAFKVGDKVQVRLIIKNNKDLDFVTVKDERAACFEPVDQISGHRYADRAWYYLETKDAITNLFFTDLQKGTHVITYDLYVTNSGEFSAGIATAQCQYAPQLTAHSAGKTITVE